jgi:hypothetical protein
VSEICQRHVRDSVQRVTDVQASEGQYIEDNSHCREAEHHAITQAVGAKLPFHVNSSRCGDGVSHLKKLKKKLPANHFPRTLTCFLFRAQPSHISSDRYMFIDPADKVHDADAIR